MTKSPFEFGMSQKSALAPLLFTINFMYVMFILSDNTQNYISLFFYDHFLLLLLQLMYSSDESMNEWKKRFQLNDDRSKCIFVFDRNI